MDIRFFGHGVRFDVSFLCIAIFMLVVMLAGGASRADVASQIIVRLAAVGLGAVACLSLARGQVRPYSAPLLMLTALGALMLAQLIPLPPALWTALPGRELLGRLAIIADFEQPWRPISITPDLTINSFLALTVPVAAMLLFARLSRRGWLPFIILLVLLIGFSAIIGLAQITNRLDALYLYRITNQGVAVGLFANRNHQAALLAMSLPILAAMAVFPAGESKAAPLRTWGAMIGALLAFPLILVTGSRAGLILLVVAVALAAFLYFRSNRPGGVQAAGAQKRAARHGRVHRKNYRLAALIFSVGAVVGLTIYMARAEAVRRLFDQDVGQELRFKVSGTIIDMICKYFPIGSGFGSFENIYRIDEINDNLMPEYLNHAHNDLFEFVLEGGFPAIVIMCAFMIWFFINSLRAWGSVAVINRSIVMARLGSCMVIILLIASVIDYPLRTPIMMAFFAFACMFLCLRADADSSDPVPEDRGHRSRNGNRRAT